MSSWDDCSCVPKGLLADRLLNLPSFPPPTQETQRLQAEPVQGIVAQPDEDNARYFHVTVNGPQDVSCLSHQYVYISPS